MLSSQPTTHSIASAAAIDVTRALPRPRLQRRLDATRGERVTLVLGPRGSGKTTLLAQWVTRASPQVAGRANVGWLATGPTEALIEGTAGMGLLERAERIAHTTPTADAPVIVIDAAGEPEPDLGDTVRALLQCHPLLRVVLACEHTPPALSALLTSAECPGRVAVRAADLRLRSYEIEELFRRECGIALDRERVAAVSRMTEGWPGSVRGLLLSADWTLPSTPAEVLGAAPEVHVGTAGFEDCAALLRDALGGIDATRPLESKRMLRARVASAGADSPAQHVAELLLLAGEIGPGTVARERILERADDLRRRAGVRSPGLALAAETVVAALLEHGTPGRRLAALSAVCRDRHEATGTALIDTIIALVRLRMDPRDGRTSFALAEGADALGLHRVAMGFRETRERASASAVAATHSRVPEAPPALRNQNADRVRVACFGAFQLNIDGAVADLAALRPRVLTMLHILALNAGRPVHRDILAATLWGDQDSASALHSLHVTISSLRRTLGTSCGDGGGELLVRRGETYALAVDSPLNCDLTSFDAALQAASTARSRGDGDTAAAALRRAVALYAGEVLPEAGAAEWVLGARDRYRLRASEAAVSLAHLELRLGDARAAGVAAARAVEFDPWRDESWRALITMSRQAGDFAEAERAERGYARVLDSLEVPR